MLWSAEPQEATKTDYKKKELWRQILDEPDTFDGGTDLIEDVLPVMKDSKIIVKECKYIPAILKLFDEIFSTQKKRIYKALINSNSKEVVNFNNVLKKIINE